jgi:hypothetical protein
MFEFLFFIFLLEFKEGQLLSAHCESRPICQQTALHKMREPYILFLEDCLGPEKSFEDSFRRTFWDFPNQ